MKRRKTIKKKKEIEKKGLKKVYKQRKFKAN